MAKKGQAIQLQAEINTDEDWEKLLQRDGLIIVDVYSEWCGPCSGMAANLKKIKLEIGGDLLQLAIAKADNIEALKRFRNKSEPTWMFIVNGKMVNFMFGANAPKLTRLIIDELKKEKDARDGRRERVQTEISDLTDEEKERIEVIEGQEREILAKERNKAKKELHDRRVAEANHILENLNHLGVILIFPHAKGKYMEAFGDLLGEAGLTITQTEKNVNVTEEQLSELFYFLDEEEEFPFPEETVEQLLNNPVTILLIKPIPARTVTEPTDTLLLEVIYGPMSHAPGSANSAAQVLGKITQPGPEEGVEETVDMIGCWTPQTEQIKATALRLFFPRTAEHYIIPEPEPTPPHYAVVFDAYRRSELLQLMDKYHKEIIRYGFFTSEKPEEAAVVAKSIHKYEKTTQRGPNEKMVIQLSKKKSECVLAFVQMKPNYISPNAAEGLRDCRIFFPDDYDEPPDEEEEEEEEALKTGAEGAAKRSSAEEEAGLVMDEPPEAAAAATETAVVSESGAEAVAQPETAENAENAEIPTEELAVVVTEEPAAAPEEGSAPVAPE